MFNVNFRLLKTIYVHLLVCYLSKLQNARCNGKDHIFFFCDANTFLKVKLSLVNYASLHKDVWGVVV